MELFEQIRREYEHGVGTIRAVAKKLGVHRRMVREALADALPPERKKALRPEPKLGPVKDIYRRHFGSGSASTAEAAAHRASDLRSDPAGNADGTDSRVYGTALRSAEETRNGRRAGRFRRPVVCIWRRSPSGLV